MSTLERQHLQAEHEIALVLVFSRNRCPEGGELVVCWSALSYNLCRHLLISTTERVLIKEALTPLSQRA